MKRVKITVVKKTYNEELVEKYGSSPGSLCSVFEVGQEFVVDGLAKPANFCDWAWNDIEKTVLILLFDGNFGDFSYKNKNSIISCCTDGLRPVTFLLEKLE